jgi:hypothetical protein
MRPMLDFIYGIKIKELLSKVKKKRENWFTTQYLIKCVSNFFWDQTNELKTKWNFQSFYLGKTASWTMKSMLKIPNSDYVTGL